MGEVYKATDTRLERTVAIKVLPPELTRDEHAKQRFVQEAKAASALDHPSICTIYDIGETDEGQIYLAMAFCDGESLRQRIEADRIRIDDTLDIATQIADGLADAHAHGIIHRDIKPANVMFTHGRTVKLVDFGLAKLAGQTGLTQSGTALGTANYMSPEQMRGEEVDHRTDIWALGVVLYEMIAGQLPFRGDNYVAIATATTRNTPAPLSSLRTGVPLALERVVARALAKQPAARFQSASDFAAELKQLRFELERSTTAAHLDVTSPPERRLGRVASRWRLAVILGAVGAIWLLSDRPAPPRDIRLTNIRQLTAAVGVEDYPAWSPDGQVLAYAATPTAICTAATGTSGSPRPTAANRSTGRPITRETTGTRAGRRTVIRSPSGRPARAAASSSCPQSAECRDVSRPLQIWPPRSPFWSRRSGHPTAPSWQWWLTTTGPTPRSSSSTPGRPVACRCRPKSPRSI